MLAALDLPVIDTPSDPLSVRVQGWLYCGENHPELAGVEIAGHGKSLGRTSLLYPRSDVAATLKVPSETPVGFTLLCDAPESIGKSSLDLTVHAVWRDGRKEPILNRAVPLSTRDYREGDWGVLVNRAFPHLVRREHMYNSGPAQEQPSAETVSLLLRYLPPAPARVIDVGCGRGSYAEPLRTAGYDWIGAEISDEDCAVLAQKNLPHCRVDGAQLPFANESFDAAVCVEVLEHTDNPWHFIADVRRVIRKRLLVSVPNLELVAYWREHRAVPWHLLESDHKNFFSRASLRELLRPHFRHVEIISYGAAPLRTIEGAPLDYHLFAIAEA